MYKLSFSFAGKYEISIKILLFVDTTLIAAGLFVCFD